MPKSRTRLYPLFRTRNPLAAPPGAGQAPDAPRTVSSIASSYCDRCCSGILLIKGRDAAMVDSLVHHAEVIELKGETYLNTAESRKTSGPRCLTTFSRV